MSASLNEFHFNPVKLGQILKQLCKDKGISIAYLHKRTDITRDTIENIMRGAVRDVKFEQIFKFCVVLGIPVEALLLLMLKDEDIDFIDQVLLYDNKEDEAIPASDIDSVPGFVPDTVVAAAEAVAAAENPPQPAQNTRTAEEYIIFLQSHVDRLTALLDKAMTK
jgi:transcriptional regulator with XRE-family HTH domain